jgi:Flp pilus assembly pilin Flp
VRLAQVGAGNARRALIESEDKHMAFLLMARTNWLGIARDGRGQDLIEYALMAGFVAVAAGALSPGVASSISTIYSNISSTISAAAAEG